MAQRYFCQALEQPTVSNRDLYLHTHKLTHPPITHRNPIQYVTRMHSHPIVGDDNELGLVKRELMKDSRKSKRICLIKRSLNLIKQYKRRRVRMKNGTQQCAIEVSVRSPPDKAARLLIFLPGGHAVTSMPVKTYYFCRLSFYLINLFDQIRSNTSCRSKKRLFFFIGSESTIHFQTTQPYHPQTELKNIELNSFLIFLNACRMFLFHD
jgi:hypothetical protein